MRAVMLSPQERILMMKLREPVTRREFWITPGGRAQAGERDSEALLRELREETSRQDFSIGPVLWTREMTYTWNGRTVSQFERYYLVEADEFDAAMEDDAGSSEVRAFLGFRWWSSDEIVASPERFGPVEIPDLLRRLVSEGPPAKPIDLGRQST